MDREFLKNYSEKENELGEVFLKTFQDDDTVNYPPHSRFNKIMEPVALAENLDLYSIMPFFGTTIVPILAVDERNFKAYHKFDISHIERLVNYSKETGKLNFILGDDPIKYIGLDFFDPIFKELNPPFWQGLSHNILSEKDELDEIHQEFNSVAATGYKKWVFETFYEVGPEIYFTDALRTYTLAKLSGYIEMTDLILSLMRNRYYGTIHDLLGVTDQYLNRPITNRFSAIPNYSYEFLKKVESFNTIRGVDGIPQRIPFDIGKTIINKLSYAPSNLESCIDVINRYDQEDLSDLIFNMYLGVKRSNEGKVEDSRDAINEKLDELWEEARSLKDKGGFIKTLVPVSFGLLGPISQAFNAAQGFLATVGISVIGTVLGTKVPAVTEKLSRLTQENYLVTIFDFQNKYNLTTT